MKRTFVEFRAVSRELSDTGVSDEDLREMQRQMMAGNGVVVRGTGGLRKIRCSIAGKGKSGGVRVIFADYPDYGLCLLVAAFAKNIQANLSARQRSDLAKLKAGLDMHMKARTKEPKP